MSVVKRKKRNKSIPPIIELHNLEKRFAAREIVLEIGVNPANPKKKETRIRRQCSYDRLLSRCVITQKQRDCLDRFAILCEQSVGRTKNIYATISDLFHNKHRYGRNFEPTFRQSRAFEKIFKIRNMLGVFNSDIIVMLAIGNMDCQEIGKRLNIEKNKLYGNINSACIRLEEIMENDIGKIYYPPI
ncbi:hypothetical protein H3S71_02060 [Commensalibacter sp. W8133]|uniref:hypothetical protein n=1 Tax=Commensalibacter sp. W8133 TaxID=2750953 RepID=UPI0018DE2FD5|nr:hypothetical protein [Commensalibacter sp. W8133]MBI0018116.1 hypothetical protein [Commensalibacter sp. W8133]